MTTRVAATVIWAFAVVLAGGCSKTAAPVSSPDLRAADAPISAARTQGGTTMTKTDDRFDADRAAKAALVLRAVALGPGQGDKYAWVRIRVVAVIKNSSEHPVPPELEVAYYSGKAGVPMKECTVYLEPYSDAPNHPWKLLGGDGDQGVSHVTG